MINLSLINTNTNLYRSKVHSLCVSTDGRLFSGHANGVIIVWDISTCTRDNSCTQIKVLYEHTNIVSSMCVSKNNQYLFSGLHDNDSKIIIWDLNNYTRLTTLLGHKIWIYSICLSLDNSQLFSCSLDGILKIWNLTLINESNCLATIDTLSWILSNICLSIDGKYLFTGSSSENNKDIKMWNILSNKCEYIFTGHNKNIMSLCVSFDGHLLFSGTDDGSIFVWSITFCYYNLISMLSKNKKIKNKKINNNLPEKCLNILTGHTASVKSLCIYPDNKLLFSGSADETIRVWDILSYTCLIVLDEHAEAIFSVCLSTDLTKLFSGSADGSVKVWEINLNKNLGDSLKYKNKYLKYKNKYLQIKNENK